MYLIFINQDQFITSDMFLFYYCMFMYNKRKRLQVDFMNMSTHFKCGGEPIHGVNL